MRGETIAPRGPAPRANGSAEAERTEGERILLAVCHELLTQLLEYVEADERERMLDAIRRRDVPLPIAQAAALFRKGPNLFRQAIRAGELPGYRIGEREVSVYPSEVDRWIRSRRIETRRDRARRRIGEGRD